MCVWLQHHFSVASFNLCHIYGSLFPPHCKKKKAIVGADSLVGRCPTWARVPARGPFPNPSPSLSHFSSCLLDTSSMKGKTPKVNIKKEAEIVRFWDITSQLQDANWKIFVTEFTNRKYHGILWSALEYHVNTSNHLIPWFISKYHGIDIWYLHMCCHSRFS